jgi:hypothetical protein
MRERIKTLILLLLVTSSIVLTGRLLFGQPMLETAAPPSYEQLVFGELRPVTDHILPELRLGEEADWLTLYPWDNGHKKAWGLLLELVRFGEPPDATLPPEKPDGLAAYAAFPSPVLIGLWVPTSRFADLEITGIAWFASNPQTVWFSDIKDQWYASSLPLLPDDWEKQLNESFDQGTPYRSVPAQDWEPLITETEILLPRDTPSFPPYVLRKEELDTDKVVRSIFVNTSLVRRIEERGGAVIYTDGQRGLRLFDHGEIEFTSPKSEPGLEVLGLEQALRRAAQYLYLMGGWTDHLYVDTYVSSQRPSWDANEAGTYTISFLSVQHGIRLEAPKPPLKLRFSDRGVIDYNRQVVMLEKPTGPEKALIDPRQAIGTVAEQLVQINNDAKLIRVYPALYAGRWPGRDVAQPAWVFLFDNGCTVVVHGYTGQIMAFQE